MPTDTPRETFAAGWGTVLTTAGVAIGLGNVWRFPYMMGSYGGAVFLAIYLLVVVFFGIPALACEQALGRATRLGPFGAFCTVGMPGAKLWGGLLLVTVTMAASYYGVVVAWVLDFSVLSALGRGAENGLFDRITASVPHQAPGILVTVAIACLTLHFGVRRGIERLSRWVMPLFFVLFVVLIVRSLTLPGALAKLAQYLVPQWGALNGQTVLAALGQAYFSIALGGTFMVIYGSYLAKEEPLLRTAAVTALIDSAAALMAGLVVVPAVLSQGLDMQAGPTLLFDVMPGVFDRLPAGSVFAVLFYLSVFLVALLSLMAAYEVVVATLVDEAGWRRDTTLWGLGAVQVALAVPALVLPGYIEQSDFLWGSTMQVLGGGLAVVALVWSYGRARALAAMGIESGPRWRSALLLFWVRWVIPVGIFATLAFGWWERWMS